jgi:ABC-type nitrate/sulfonate/bicarbonate transport system substrate-binding protein
MIPGAPLVPVLALESKYPGRFRIISHSVMTSDKPFDRVLVKSESSIKSPKDLAGKKLALIPGTTATNVMRAFLKQQGVDPQSVSFIQLAPTAQLPACLFPGSPIRRARHQADLTHQIEFVLAPYV